MAIVTYFRSVLAVPASTGRWQIEKFYFVWCPACEGSVLRNVRAIEQETNSIDSLIFQGVTKVS